jgi:NAD(P)H dehydrogenase (quinone)
MHVLIVLDHPYGAAAHDNRPHDRSLVAAMVAAARAGLDAAGHTHELVDLAAIGFDPVLSADDLRAWRLETPAREDVLALQQQLAAVDHLVLAFPTWWMSPPARTKGYLDRVLTPGFAFDEPTPGAALVRRLHRLGGVTVLTAMTTPGLLYRTWFGSPLRFVLGRGTFRLIGVRRVRYRVIDRSGQRSADSRARALARVTRAMRALPTPSRG